MSLNKIYREDFHAYEIDDELDYIQSSKEKKIQEFLYRNGIQIGMSNILIIIIIIHSEITVGVFSIEA